MTRSCSTAPHEVREAEPGYDGADRAVPGDREVLLLHGERVHALAGGEVGRGDGGVAPGAGQVVQSQGLVGAAGAGTVLRGPEHTSRSSVMPSSSTLPRGAVPAR